MITAKEMVSKVLVTGDEIRINQLLTKCVEAALLGMYEYRMYVRPPQSVIDAFVQNGYNVEDRFEWNDHAGVDEYYSTTIFWKQ